MKKKFVLASGNRQVDIAVASELRRQGSNERLVGRNGELNASNNKDLIAAIAQLMEVASTSKVVTEQQATEIASAAQTHREMVQAAFDSPEELAALGDLLAENLTVAANRDGFMRRFLRQQDLENGAIPSVRMNTKNVTAAVATGPVQTQTQFVRDNMYYPNEFYITARPYLEQKDIVRSTTDLLEEKYVDALEAIMVQEDRTYLAMVDSLVGLDNPHLNIAGAVTPQAFAELTSYVNDWGVTPAAALLSSDVWKDIVSNVEWSDIIDPVSQHELLLTGKLGVIHGMEIVSDHFRHPQHKVLGSGEVYVLGAADQHGQYTDRGGVEAQPIDGTQERVPGRGWFMSETISMVIANSRSVARGKRA